MESLNSEEKHTPLVLCCTKSGFYNSLQSLRHALNEWQTVLFINLAPTFSDCGCQISFAVWSLVMDHFLQLPPQIFNWIEIQTICRPWHWPYVSFFKECFHTFCSMARCIVILKNDFIIPKHPFKWWDKKSVQNVNINLCIYWRCNDNHLPSAFTWHAAPYHQWLWKSACFLQAVVFTNLIGTAPNKSSSIITLRNTDSRFITEWLSSSHPQSTIAFP